MPANAADAMSEGAPIANNWSDVTPRSRRDAAVPCSSIAWALVIAGTF